MNATIETVPLYEEVTKSALTWVNNMRAEYGIDPADHFPRGRRNDGQRCPVARALAPCMGGAVVCRVNAILFRPGTNDDHYIETPQYVERFIEQFDAGMHPDLLERKD